MNRHRSIRPNPRSHARLRRSAHPGLIALLASALVTTSCGIGNEDSFEVIPPQDIPFGLDQPSTTTSTTTSTSVPVDEDDEPTTTTIGLQTEPVEVYFVAGLDRLQRQTLQLSSPVGPFQVIAVLAEEPSGEQSAGLRTIVVPRLVRDVLAERGVATIDLDREVLDVLSPRDQRLVIAQLVLSMIGSVRGIGQVRFTVDEVPAEIGIPPDYTLSEPGEPLAFVDFESLLVTSAVGPTPSSTTPSDGPTTSDEAAPTTGSDTSVDG